MLLKLQVLLVLPLWLGVLVMSFGKYIVNYQYKSRNIFSQLPTIWYMHFLLHPSEAAYYSHYSGGLAGKPSYMFG
jgi:hypothetical protein